MRRWGRHSFPDPCRYQNTPAQALIQNGPVELIALLPYPHSMDEKPCFCLRSTANSGLGVVPAHAFPCVYSRLCVCARAYIFKQKRDRKASSVSGVGSLNLLSINQMFLEFCTVINSVTNSLICCPL